MEKTSSHHLIKYRTGTPVFTGVYACRVRVGSTGTTDAFIVWNNGQWVANNMDFGPFMGTVLGWLGPLQRRIVY